MTEITAIYGSPRRNGNTSTLLKSAVSGALEMGAAVNEIVLRDMKMSPCLEIYGCKKDGECAIKDDFAKVRDALLSADGIMIASPVFFYTVSAHTKILMDRCQSLWVKKYWIDQESPGKRERRKKALVISAGATRGKKLFDGMLLSMKYFFDVLDAEVWDTLLFKGLDFQGDVDKHPGYIDSAREAGKAIVTAVES